MHDTSFENRISDHLLSKMSISSDSTGFTDRNVREAIRLLEELQPVAPSSYAMRHKERQLKGLVAEYWHVHVPESHLARTYNNFGRDKSDLKANPTQEETVDKGRRFVLESFAKSRSIPCNGLSEEEISDNIIAYAKKKKMPEDELNRELTKIITASVDKPFTKANSSSGDWLLFWKNDQGVRFYLDVSIHIEPQDSVAQAMLKCHLDALRSSLLATYVLLQEK